MSRWGRFWGRWIFAKAKLVFIDAMVINYINTVMAEVEQIKSQRCLHTEGILSSRSRLLLLLNQKDKL